MGIWAAAMAGITAFQCASSLLFRFIINKRFAFYFLLYYFIIFLLRSYLLMLCYRMKFLTVYSSIVAVGAFGSFVGNCIAKDGPGKLYCIFIFILFIYLLTSIRNCLQCIVDSSSLHYVFTNLCS